MPSFKIGYFLGSLAGNSINRTLSKALIGLAPDGLELKAAIEGSDGIPIVSPEYTRSIPGALKNAIDWVPAPGARTLSRASPPESQVAPSVGAGAGAHRRRTL